MIIKTLSASRLKSYEGCPKRTLAEMSVRLSSPPGDFGTAVHATLEWFHKLLEDGAVTYDLAAVLKIWETVCAKHLGWASPYEETGIELLTRYMEEHPEPPEVVSQEIKESFPLVTEDGTEIGVTYIIDRVDRDSEYGYRIIDYKTQYGRVNPESMWGMVQPLLYACALRRKYGVTKVPVTYIMLRQVPQDITIVITEREMDKFERYLLVKAQEILDDDEPREKLNAECGFCIRKGVCTTWSKAVEAGWTPTMELPVLASKHAEAKAAEKAAGTLAKEIEAAIMTHMRTGHIYTAEAGDYDIKVTLPRTGAYNPEGVFRVLGESALPFMKVGKTVLDKEVKRKRGGMFTEEEKAALMAALVITEGEPGLKIEKRIDEDLA